MVLLDHGFVFVKNIYERKTFFFLVLVFFLLLKIEFECGLRININARVLSRQPKKIQSYL